MASNKAAAGNVAVTAPPYCRFRRTAPGSVSARVPVPARTSRRLSEREGARLLPIIACLRILIRVIVAEPPGFVKGSFRRWADVGIGPYVCVQRTMGSLQSMGSWQ